MVLTPGREPGFTASPSPQCLFLYHHHPHWRKQMLSGTEKGQPSHLGSTSCAFSMPAKPNLDTDEGLGQM